MMANWDLKGRTALVIGGTKGIGLATTKTFLALGATVYFVSRTASDVERLSATYQSKQLPAYGLTADLAQKDAPDDIKTELQTKYGVSTLDILVNIIGQVTQGDCESLNDEVIDKGLNLNIAAMIRLNRTFFPLLKEGDSSSVINIASSNAFIATPHKSLDGLTRAAVVSFTKSLSHEWAEYGIRVNAVAPGPTKTERMHQYDETVLNKIVETIPLKRMGRPDEIANAIAFLGMPASSFITGQCLIADGGYLL